MQHLLPLYFILCLLPGIAALTVLSVLVSRLKINGLTLFTIAYGCLTVNLLLDLVWYYLGINISEEISSGVYTLFQLAIPFALIMQTTLPLAINDVIRIPAKRRVNRVFILIATVELALYYTPLVMDYSRETQTIFFGPLYSVFQGIFIVFLGYSVVMVLLRRRIIVNRLVRKYILVMAAVLGLFLPVITYEQFLFRGGQSIDTVPANIILMPLFYMISSLTTLIFAIRFLLSPTNQQDDSDQLTGERPSSGAILQKLAETAGLSDREMTIIPLMVQGLSNKQIALELHISPKTVGNHIYNIYRKLNISSRYELLALLK